MIVKMLIVNVIHLSEKTMEMLADEAVADCAGLKAEKKFEFLKVCIFGHPNYTGQTYMIDIDKQKLQSAFEEECVMPDDLRSLLREAFVEQCDVVRLSDDAPIHESLNQYE